MARLESVSLCPVVIGVPAISRSLVWLLISFPNSRPLSLCSVFAFSTLGLKASLQDTLESGLKRQQQEPKCSWWHTTVGLRQYSSLVVWFVATAFWLWMALKRISRIIKAFIAEQASRPSCGGSRNKCSVGPSGSGPCLFLGPSRPAFSCPQMLLPPGCEHVSKMVILAVNTEEIQCGGPEELLPPPRFWGFIVGKRFTAVATRCQQQFIKQPFWDSCTVFAETLEMV